MDEPIRDLLGARNVLNLCKKVFLWKLIIIRLVKISPKFIILFWKTHKIGPIQCLLNPLSSLQIRLPVMLFTSSSTFSSFKWVFSLHVFVLEYVSLRVSLLSHWCYMAHNSILADLTMRTIIWWKFKKCKLLTVYFSHPPLRPHTWSKYSPQLFYSSVAVEFVRIIVDPVTSNASELIYMRMAKRGRNT